jgi:hypothetical protein
MLLTCLHLIGLTVSVHYELFQGLPALRKWVSVAVAQTDSAGADVVVGNVITETLRTNSDYAGGMYCPITVPPITVWRAGDVICVVQISSWLVPQQHAFAIAGLRRRDRTWRWLQLGQ